MTKSLLITFLILLFTGNHFQVLGQKSDLNERFVTKKTIRELREAPVRLIPYPDSIVWEDGGRVMIDGLKLQGETKIIASLQNECQDIVREKGFSSSEKHSLAIKLEEIPEMDKEAYNLLITQHGVTVQSSTEEGFYYGMKTLRQLIIQEKGVHYIPKVKIVDKPQFPVRGFMVDVGRNYQELDLLKKQLDIMSDYKMNVFHWHLTDRPAWRIESKAFPQLTAAENHRKGRDPGRYYTYSEIRELIVYAKERKIQVIPEIDMPGHSDSFTKAMGFRMESEQGMDALKVILTEFFSEIPKELAPIIHIGSDEVHVPNPKEFMERMVAVVESNGRKAMMWSPGLPASPSVLRQSWGEMDTVKAKDHRFLEIDSRNSYINNAEPMTFVNKLLFKPIGATMSQNDCLGGILCLWHDVNVADQKEVYLNNPVYPGLLTYAWATWTADVLGAPAEYMVTLPPGDTDAADYFNIFEDYLLDHKNRFFEHKSFPYLRQNDRSWKLYGPIDQPMTDIGPIDKWISEGGEFLQGRGNTIIIRDRFQQGGYFPGIQKGETVVAKTSVFSEDKREVLAWIAFETPLRANRTYGGIPEKGNWDVQGGKIWVNGEALPAPEWENPGWHPSKIEGWGSKQDQEVSWAQEELYWRREPYKLSLEKGMNEVTITIPYANKYQNCMVTFAILDKLPYGYDKMGVL